MEASLDEFSLLKITGQATGVPRKKDPREIRQCSMICMGSPTNLKISGVVEFSGTKHGKNKVERHALQRQLVLLSGTDSSNTSTNTKNFPRQYEPPICTLCEKITLCSFDTRIISQ